MLFTRSIKATLDRGNCCSTRFFNSNQTSSELSYMDKIRARGFLKHTYVYNPPNGIAATIEEMARLNGFDLHTEDWRLTEVPLSSKKKSQLLIDLGRTLNHFVPNSKLHKIKILDDLLEFYSKPVNNITKYAEMSRNKDLPENLAILEHNKRFHPNDINALHGGVTAFPGEGGCILGIRNKRLKREFKPKRDWFDYEDQAFNYDVELTKGMPWDPEIARKMDSYTNVRFSADYIKKTK